MQEWDNAIAVIRLRDGWDQQAFEDIDEAVSERHHGIVTTGDIAGGTVSVIIPLEPLTRHGVRTIVLDALRDLELDVAVEFREEHFIHVD
jgi:hypothetical protein